MVTIQSPDGHDGFLLEFDQINKHVLRFIHDFLPEIAEKEVCDIKDVEGFEKEIIKDSLFGEAEIIKW